MERVDGQELLVWAKSAPQEERDRVAELLLDLLMSELFQMGQMQTDPNPANYLYDSEKGRLVLLDFGAARHVPLSVQDIYRRAFVALARRDREATLRVLGDLGLKPREGSPAIELLVEISLEASDAFQPGVFDFKATDLSERLHARGKELARHQRDLKSPPPEFIFFQRKLGGTFLLCRQLEARVDCHALLVKHGLIH
jgi:predicted unusual protein kinase regulating ubiquinone biosynthesis (AarF/ABC1/UbiB family)